jgi:hypothetical protein
MGFVGRKPTNAPLTSDDIPNGIIGAEDLAAGLSKITFDTTPKTTGFTAVANTGYFCNTTSAGFTVTLPATPSAGDQVQLVDYAGTFDTNALTIDPNGEDIEGGTNNLVLKDEREGVILTYIDSTQGWIATSGINEGTDALEPETYSVNFLVIAGGGSGGNNASLAGGSGGGAGGYRNSVTGESSGGNSSAETPLTLEVGTTYTITVGAGGAAKATQGNGNSGVDSSISGTGISTITSIGGGAGVENTATSISGGSGGGAAGGGNFTGGAGTANQGSNGGDLIASSGYQVGAGGGGAGQVGQNGTTSGSVADGGDGGNGLASSISGSSVTRAGGGAGGGDTRLTETFGTGGSGGGGNASATTGGSGTVNTGSGGGGGGSITSGAGGSGVVILSMPLTRFSGTVTGSPTESDDGTTKRLIFNGSGSYTG